MTPQRKAEIGMLAAPFAVVLVLQITAQIRPSASFAKPTSFEGAATRASSETAHDDELSTWIDSLEITNDMRSPMDHGPTPEVQLPVRPITVPTPMPDYENPLESAALTSVIGKGDQGLVSINGRVYRMNEEPAPGCPIVFIDANRKMVGIQLPTGDIFYIYAIRP